MEIFCFLVGILYYYTQSKLALFCLLAILFMRPQWRLLMVFFIACLIGMTHQWWVADCGMPTKAVIPHASLSGVIASIPTQTAEKTKFEFNADHLNHQPIRARLQLACYQHCPELHAGEHWKIQAKLHQVHNLNNPGGFDYKTLMAARHIHWTGYVLRGAMHKEMIKTDRGILQWREHLAGRLARIIPDETSLGIVQALTVGVTSHISQASWTLFRCTGTTHLMVISGAHIGLITGLIFQGMVYLWSRSERLMLRYPAQKIASWVAIGSGASYAMIAGFSLPAERAIIASILIFARYLGQRKFSAWQAWRYALLVVLLSEPHAVLMPGFYLSFMAVAILLTMNQRLLATGVRKLGALQLSCMLGLLPFTIFWFSYGAVNGLLANIVAIPWVSFVIVPLSLLSLIVGGDLPWLLTVLHQSITVFMVFLHWVDQLSGLNVQMGYANVILPLAWMLAMGTVIVLPLSVFWPAATALLFAALYPGHPVIPEKTFQANILDVGQGLAVVIRTHAHILIYDTGGQIYHGADMGQLVLVPYLKLLGMKYLDAIVISHPDLDHRGGLATLEAKYPGTALIVDQPGYYHRGDDCHTYPDWTWDGVLFHFFSLSAMTANKNNHSCVLQVSNQSGQLLLTGDIEQIAEQMLVDKYGERLHSTVLVSPHHGSKTSSSLGFLNAVAPEYAILSYGFDNRYHFPHAVVMDRYRRAKIKTYGTAEEGMLTVLFSKKSVEILKLRY
ncbi:MAG: DNA internalization-related competence protein ComEC/Rec2 [Gammaproteobacteria bacterium]|nr:DNA internalization-related competence protein ComEC/Rec2 [Gammaproteobacteria bacterium]